MTGAGWALLLLAATAALGGVPLYAIVCLPILFAAGMSLLDTLDGAFMAFAYGWSAAGRTYTRAVTGLSVAVALVVGGAELVSLAGPHVDLGSFAGYGVAGLFVVAWAAALAVRRVEAAR